MSDQITTTIIFLSSTQTSASAATSSSFRPTSTPSSESEDTSFVGNTPATVLFFLALGVGIFIGSLFIFFTLRYFVRARYGLNVYSISRRNIMLSSMDSLQNIDDQWEFIRMHHDYLISRLRDRTLTRSGNIISLNRRGRRRRNNRFSKMKKLTIDEVEELFPKITYKNWLSSGKKDYTNILHEEEEDVEVAEQMQEIQEMVDLRNSIELNEITPIGSTPRSNLPKHLSLSNSSLNRLDSLKSFVEPASNHDANVPQQDIYDLSNPHYTSGSCAICLEIIEDDDEVRGLMCGHVFHSECLDPWLTKRRACCPMCKRDYYRNETTHDNSTTNDENDIDLGESSTNNNNNNNSNTNTNNDNNNNESNSNHNNNESFNQTTDANNDDSDNESFNFETFRSDPVIRAMLQELIPPAERVRLILADEGNASLHFDEKANRIADKKFDNIFKRLWWRIMGINKENLYHWAVVNLYNNHRSEQAMNQHNNDSNDHQEQQREGTEAQSSGQTTNNDNSSNSTNSNDDDTVSNVDTNLHETQEIASNMSNHIADINSNHTLHSDTLAPTESPYSPVTDDTGHVYIHRHV